MPLAIKCGECGYAFGVRDEFAGKRGKCPKCGAVFQAPGGKVAAAAPAAADSSPSISVVETSPRKSGPSGSSVLDAPPRRDLSDPALTETAPLAAQQSRSTVGAGKSPKAASAPSAKAKNAATAPLSARGPLDDRLASYKRHRTSVPAWVWFVMGGMVLAGLVGAVVARNIFVKQQTANARPVRREPAGPRLNTAPLAPEVGPSQPIERPERGASADEVIAYIEHGIVRIEAYDDYSNRFGIGSGCIVDRRGLVATNYHVISQASKADVLFKDGTRYGVAGYVALRPQSDLAIVLLNGVPAGVQALDIKVEPPARLSAVFAIGHPHNYVFTATKGDVNAVVKTSELPEDAQAFLTAYGTDDPNNVWIQHDAKIAGGNSGGPIVDTEGNILGINTWGDDSVEFGFAIHSRHLADLLKTVSSTPEPLERHMKAPPEVGATPPGQVPGQPPVVAPPVATGLTPEAIRLLLEETAQFDWSPTNQAEFDKLRELAKAVTQAKFADPSQAGTVGLAEEADLVAQAFSGVAWEADRHVTTINDYAAKALNEPQAGVFVFGVVQAALLTPDGATALLIGLAGRSEAIVVVAEKDRSDFAALSQGASCIVLGQMTQNTATITLEGGAQQTAPVVATRTVVVEAVGM